MKILLLITALAGFLVTAVRAEENDPLEDYMMYHMFDHPSAEDAQQDFQTMHGANVNGIAMRTTAILGYLREGWS